MRLSTKARYAVMAMADLAKLQSFQKNAVPLTVLAARQNLPLSFLEQIFLKLRNKGLVNSLRGASGGYVLAKEASLIPVADVIMAVDKPFKATQCVDNRQGCQVHGRCLTHDLWEELSAVMHSFLESVSLADIYQKHLRRSDSLLTEGRSVDNGDLS